MGPSYAYQTNCGTSAESSIHHCQVESTLLACLIDGLPACSSMFSFLSHIVSIHLLLLLYACSRSILVAPSMLLSLSLSLSLFLFRFDVPVCCW